MAKAKNTNKSAKSINLKQQQFVNLYTDITNKQTFSNATQSYLQAYQTDNYGVAAVEGNRLLKKPHVKSEIETLIESQKIIAIKKIRIFQ